VAADVEEECFLECSEKGFALFEEDGDEPLIHLSFSAENSGEKLSQLETRTVISDEVTFDLPDPDKKYMALAYAVADGKYYYDDVWVDLGLPSGILWAKWNVGASSPEEYGGYYAWGETEEKSIYTNDTYKYASVEYCSECKGSYYKFENIGECISGTKYDVAHIKWGDGARMPTDDEIREIVYGECHLEEGTLNNVKGVYCIGPNGNSIFLPAAGEYSDTLREAGFNGHCAYRTCQRVSKLSGNTDNIVWGLWYCNDTDCPVPIYTYVGRTTGHPVRPVCP
jgi:hypothetical protein